MTMIEKVARALCINADTDPDIIVWGKYNWQAYEQEAKAAIEVMREPSEEMLNEFGEDDKDWIERYWKPAIDAALKEE